MAWNGHRLIGAAAAGGLAAAFPLLAAGSAASPAAAQQATLRPPEAIYARTCGYCHGHNVGPVIRGRAIPAETVAYMVRHGQGAMPAFRPTEITEAELARLAAWVSASRADPKEHGQ